MKTNTRPTNLGLARGIIHVSLAVLMIASGFGQDANKTRETDTTKQAQPVNRDLTSFDLDFKGGRPRDLVAAIEKATGKTLNVLIPEEYADTHIPALKMKNVFTPELFTALELASRKIEMVKSGNGYQRAGSSYGFRQAGGNNVITDDTIWCFHAEPANVPPPVKVCRFYSLASFLDRGFTVDDITTAVSTGIKMVGDGGEPAMSFHKDTKLLIAVGEPDKLEIITAVLSALPARPGPTEAPEQKSQKK